MHLTYRGVNDAFRGLVRFFAEPNPERGVSVTAADTRNGRVLKVTEPVVITYTDPLKRVLFNQARDVNPFSLLYESLYMLAGRDDVASLAFYTPRFREYSDDGRTLNGAYGRRWRKAWKGVKDLSPGLEVDQLDLIASHLTADPGSRRAVLQMWDVENDLLKISTSKDVVCNTSVMFSLRPVTCGACGGHGVGLGAAPDRGNPPCDLCAGTGLSGRLLDMTVTNRSNDLVFGMLGANFVVFSFLQEYLATRLGAGVGKYHHFTNDLHVYQDESAAAGGHAGRLKDWLADTTPDLYRDANLSGFPPEVSAACRGADFGPAGRVPLVMDPAVFEKELQSVVMNNDGRDRTWRLRYTEPFFDRVAQPAFDAFYAHKRGSPAEALAYAQEIASPDWKAACVGWLARRYAKKGVTL